jgi:hypothetical protein
MRKLWMASMALIAAPVMAFNFGMSDQGTSFGPNNWGNGNNGWNNGPSFGWGNNRSWGNGPSMNIMPGWNNNNYPPRYYYPQAPQQQAPVPVAK